MRERRRSLGLSMHALARRAGVAPSHIFHVENGQKVPSEGVAARIARELGDEQDLYRWWVRARSRSDLATTIRAAAVLEKHMRRAREAPARSAEGTDGLAGANEAVRPSPEPRAGSARLLIPVIASLAELPDDAAARPAARPLLRLDPAHVQAMDRLERPVAFDATAADVARVQDRIAPGATVVITRRVLPLDPTAIHLVRLAGTTVLARVLWNGHELLVLPASGRSDFIVLPAAREADLARHVIGAVAALPPG